MRILVTIPHFYAAQGDSPRYGSTGSHKAGARLKALCDCLRGLLTHFGGPSFVLQQSQRALRICASPATSLELAVVTSGSNHLLDDLRAASPDLFSALNVQMTDAEPMLLGYECHRVLAARVDEFDWFCFMEDDLVIHDPMFLDKVAWFALQTGRVLLPNRYESCVAGAFGKLYVDGDIRRAVSDRFQNIGGQSVLRARLMGREYIFRRPTNTHSGCFFLSADQLRHWMAQPFFLDRSPEFIGPLESAASLGVMRAFQVYKPGLHNMGFLEIEHGAPQYRGFARNLIRRRGGPAAGSGAPPGAG